MCLCQIIGESDYELLLFCSQNYVIYAYSDFALLENVLWESSEKNLNNLDKAVALGWSGVFYFVLCWFIFCSFI